VTTVAVASPLHLATDVGIDVGRRGGNAIDAALATAAMLTVAYPANCAIGGDLLALVREPDGRTTFVNASGKALRAADAGAVRRHHRKMPTRGPLAVTVPGMVGGWHALHQYGGALPWADILAPAVDAAADGVPVVAGLAESIAEAAPHLRGYPDLASILCPGGVPLTTGQTLRQPALSGTLSAIADSGPGVLYDGELSTALCTGLAARGVPMTPGDLHDFRVEELAPLKITVAGWRLQAGRPNSQAFLVLRLLGMLDSVDASSDTPLHRRLPAHRLALAFDAAASERDRLLADPHHMTESVEELLTPDALRALADEVMSLPLTARNAPISERPDGDTVAVVAADDEGRSVSLIQSLFHGFGSMILEPRTGILLHDRGACFSLDPASPNVLAPGKRPLHTLSPVLAEASDTRRLVVGTMGGHEQPQILTQVMSRLIDGETAQESVGRPRFTVGAWEEWDTTDTLNVESDLDPAMLHELAEYPGPRVVVDPHDSRVGHAQAIAVTPSGFDVGTDPRADG
jgi:gamma-glutamyltranspeptidase/glutathione hydrolase